MHFKIGNLDPFEHKLTCCIVCIKTEAQKLGQ